MSNAARRLIYSPNKELPAYNRDLTIPQRRYPWKRHWKIDSASFQTISPFFQVALLLKRREFRLELKREGRARVQTEKAEFIALPFPSSKNLKFILELHTQISFVSAWLELLDSFFDNEPWRFAPYKLALWWARLAFISRPSDVYLRLKITFSFS